jgi:signal transduction histidine kinase
VNGTGHRAPEEAGLAFFGAISASLSHELNNVFATINELSGLLDDLANAAERGQPPTPDRLKRIAARIAAHVQRGQQQSKQLNRLGHSVDSRFAEVDAAQVAAEVVALCGRSARLRRVSVESPAAQGPLLVYTDPFLLRLVIWHCIEIALAVAEPGGCVTVELCATGEGARLRTSADTPAEAVAEATAERGRELAELVRLLGGGCEVQLRVGEPAVMTLGLPRRQSYAAK